MKARARSSLATLAVVATFAAPAAARTEAEKQAQLLFDEGLRLMAQKRYAEACPKLAQSQSIDPGMGTQFRLAECYERLGKLATAFDLFHAVADAARANRQADRAAVAEKRATALEPRVPRLTVDVPSDVAAVPGLEVRRDGVVLERSLWGAPQPVDAGEHVVEVQAPGRKPWTGRASLEGAARLTIPVPPLEPIAAPREEPPPPPSRGPAIALGIVGAVGVVLGATFLGVRAAKAGSAHSLHDELAASGARCTGGASGTAFADRCASLGSATSAADAFGTASIVAFVAGGVALGGMGAWLALAPSPKSPSTEARVRAWPVAGPHDAGLVVLGAF
jgi:hypothetical protein